VENHDGVFRIHRGLRFLLVSGSAGGRTTALVCRFGVRTPDTLDATPDVGSDDDSIVIQRPLIDGSLDTGCPIPDLRTRQDLSIFSDIVFRVPAFGSAAGWRLHFGRELNVTENREDFVDSPSALPVIEGKQVLPFAVVLSSARYRIAPQSAARLLGARGSFRRPRLAYRDVASPTNKLTLIAAVVPANVVTTHTLFCLRDEQAEDVHFFLCGIFNSLVANYLVRLRVGTHVTTGIIDWLPVPKPDRASGAFLDVVRYARRLSNEPADVAAYAALQACCARLYGLTADQFHHVLRGFPLVPAAWREASFRAFGR
jgi:hypothetical protein